GIAAGDPDRAAEYAERIGISARHLAQLIEEVLAFSRLESGREVVSVESVVLQDLLNELRIIAEPLAESKGLNLRVETEGPALEIHTDARKVRQILLNVVGNAIKFADEGEVGVDWEEDGDDFSLRISDTGRGISEEHQQRIFDPFWQVEQGTTRTAGGTGLGLTVTRRFID